MGITSLREVRVYGCGGRGTRAELTPNTTPNLTMDTYRATNTLNGKFYIGSTKNFERRKDQHLHSKETYPFQIELRKNPEAFVWEVYTDNLDTNEHEVRLLREFYFDARCYNLNHDAERPPNQKGKKQWKNELTQEQTTCFEKPEGEGWERGFLQKTREKRSGENNPMYGRTGEKNPLFGVPKTAEWKKAMSGENNPRFGVSHTEESKKKMSVARSGEKNPNYGKFGAAHNRSKAIIAIKPDGTEEHYGSIIDAVRDTELGIGRGGLHHFLKTGHVSTRGKFKDWQFLYENP